MFVGWGNQPYLSEYSRSGKLLFEGEYPGPDLSYRATVGQWVGLPLTCPRARPPAGARHDGVRELERRHQGDRLAGARAATIGGQMKVLVARQPKCGFETSIDGALGLRQLRGPGADSGGHVLGTSTAFR